jgi:hypothetical protein
MQEDRTARREGAAFIWQWGVGVGAILGLIQLVISLLSLGLFRIILDLIVWLVGFFLIGLFAARHTGRVKTGTLAGLVTGLSSGLIAGLFGIYQLLANGPQITQALNQTSQRAQQQGQSISSSQFQTIAIIGIVIGLVVTLAVELGLGAGIGALGGLVGRRRVRTVASTSEVSTQ